MQNVCVAKKVHAELKTDRGGFGQVHPKRVRFRAQASCLDLVPKFLLYPWIHLLVSGLSFSNSGARLLRYRPLSSAAIDEESTCLQPFGAANLPPMDHRYR